MQILIGTEKFARRLGLERFDTLSKLINRAQFAAFALILIGALVVVIAPNATGISVFVKLCGLAFLTLGLTLIWGDISPMRYSRYSIESMKPGREWIAVVVGIVALILGAGLVGAGILMLVARL
jgi:hypothetical protein